MLVKLVGMGLGTLSTLTAEGLLALKSADLLVGSSRLLSATDDNFTHRRVTATEPNEILNAIKESGAESPCVIYSGDSGFYSGVRGLLPLLKASGMETKVFAGISSVQYFAARLERTWQDWKLISAHGTDCDIAEAVSTGRPVFFLTGGMLDAQSICRLLTKAGLGRLTVTAGENLSYENERIITGTAERLAEKVFAPLTVILTEAAFTLDRRSGGIADAEFIRGEIPMTKQEVRAVILGKLAIRDEDVCWDIGSGTGSVAVELALQGKAVYAVECSHKACILIGQNREKFGAWKLHMREGNAPEILAGLPKPDKVFIGGSGGKLSEILKTVKTANPAASICVSAIALETLHTACEVFEKLGYEAEVTQLSVSHTKVLGNLHLMTAQNPIFLITGTKL